jgi:hypothetical protein
VNIPWTIPEFALPVSIVDFGRGLTGRLGQQEPWLAVLWAYFDDSGTHSDSEVVVVGGLLGTERQWVHFEREWAKLLWEPLPGKESLSKFHLSPCQARSDPFYGYTSVESDYLIHLFNSIILDTDLVALACAVNKTAWNELVVGEVAAELGPAEGLCFVKCLEAVMSTIRLRKPGEKVTLVFDQGIADRIVDLARLYFSQKQAYPELAGIGFAKVADILPLQGADMIATWSYQYAQEWIKDRESADAKPHFKKYLHRELSYGSVLDREHIEEMVQRVRQTMPWTPQS